LHSHPRAAIALAEALAMEAKNGRPAGRASQDTAPSCRQEVVTPTLRW